MAGKMLALLLALIVMWTLRVSEGVGPTRSDCQRICGNVTIPYPFGLLGQEGCYWVDGLGRTGSSYTVFCSQVDGRETLYMRNISTNIEMLDISVESHEIRMLAYVASDCYTSSGEKDPTTSFTTSLNLRRFPISSTRNTFTSIGCDTLGIFKGNTSTNRENTNDQVYATGCVSYCESLGGITNGTCSGMGCCETDNIPKNATNYQIGVSSFYNHSLVYSFNPCSYAFMVETGYFDFSTKNLYNMTEEMMPLVLDWAIGSQTCDEAKTSVTSYTCTENTDCTNAENGSGYRCHCKAGYQGNPYILNGCLDIDECETMRPCNTTCTNLPGTYKCTCPLKFTGDGTKDGTGCSPILRHNKITPRDYVLGISIGFLILVLCLSWLYWAYRQRTAMKERKRFFKENGGLMLQELLAEHGTNVETLHVFKEEELKKATNNYHESRILGEGGQGTVYQGSVLNDRVVAIKKAKMIDRSQVNEFVNEVVLLSQINHKNVVKLVGCCLETEFPLLVYEFVANGTLFSHIHNSGPNSNLSWVQRLRIAAETAGALSYLHYDMALQIIHRDIKCTNILLDENYVSKISDFGASRLVPVDQTELNTLVQGTLGYLDPEYLHSSQLTEKSDVYSFGVVLAELITGLKAISFERAEKDRNLAAYMVRAIKEDRLLDIIDKEIMNDGNSKEIVEVGLLASRCVGIRGEDRPSMKEVAMKLDGVFRGTMDTKEGVINKKVKEEEEISAEYYGSTSSITANSGYTDSITLLAPPGPNEGR